MATYVFFGIFAGVWLAGVVPSMIAIGLSFGSFRDRFWIAVALSLLALVATYLGMTQCHFDRTNTVNGQVTYRFDSKWFFIGSLILAGFALTCAIWKKAKS